MAYYALHITPPDPETATQVAQLTFDNAGQLHMFDFDSMKPANLLLLVYKHCLAIEVARYVDRIGKLPEAPVELITAHDDATGVVIGYLLYLPVPTHRDACGVTYMAVRTGSRRQGIARKMISMVIERYPHVELTCSFAKVPLYQKLGFQVVDSHKTQIVMNTRSYSCEGMMGIEDVNWIYESDTAFSFMKELADEHGPKAVHNDVKRLKKHVATLTSRAKNFYREYAKDAARNARVVAH